MSIRTVLTAIWDAPEVAYLRAMASTRITALREDSDKGAITAETAIVVGVLATLAIAAGVVITTKVLAKANSINLDG